jgi:hypothetical protein
LSVAPAISGVISSVPTIVKNLLITNTHASTLYYAMIFDLTALPANGTYPRLNCFPIAASTTLRIPLGRLRMTTGLTWGSSSTAGSLTSAGTSLQVQAELLTSR